MRERAVRGSARCGALEIKAVRVCVGRLRQELCAQSHTHQACKRGPQEDSALQVPLSRMPIRVYRAWQPQQAPTPLKSPYRVGWSVVGPCSLRRFAYRCRRVLCCFVARSPGRQIVRTEWPSYSTAPALCFAELPCALSLSSPPPACKLPVFEPHNNSS